MARRKNLDFAGMVAKGENPNGLVMQTANGTASDKGEGNNQGYPYGYQADGYRWNGGMPPAPTKAGDPVGFSFGSKPWGGNRTGE